MTTTEEQNRQSRRSLVGFALALMVGAAVAVVVSTSASLLEEGAAAPAFELPTADGTEQVSLASLRGKVVLIDFWSTTCPPCVRQLAELEALHRARGDEADLVILGINTEGAPASLIQSFARDRGVGYTVLLGRGRVAERFRVSSLPTLYLIDREGQIRWSRVGYTSRSQLEQALDELL